MARASLYNSRLLIAARSLPCLYRHRHIRANLPGHVANYCIATATVICTLRITTSRYCLPYLFVTLVTYILHVCAHDDIHNHKVGNHLT